VQHRKPSGQWHGHAAGPDRSGWLQVEAASKQEGSDCPLHPMASGRLPGDGLQLERRGERGDVLDGGLGRDGRGGREPLARNVMREPHDVAGQRSTRHQLQPGKSFVAGLHRVEVAAIPFYRPPTRPRRVLFEPLLSGDRRNLDEVVRALGGGHADGRGRRGRTSEDPSTDSVPAALRLATAHQKARPQ
jgi:hypothetical protein